MKNYHDYILKILDLTLILQTQVDHVLTLETRYLAYKLQKLKAYTRFCLDLYASVSKSLLARFYSVLACSPVHKENILFRHILRFRLYTILLAYVTIYIQVCTNMVDTLTKQSFSYLQTNYTAPGLIPNRDGTLTRVENYTTIMESNEVVNVNLQQFDCYNSQSLTIDEQSIHIKNNLKSPMVNCSKPIKDLVGDFDTMITRIIFQEYSDFRYGNVFTIDFRTDTQVLNNTNQWFTCDQSYNKSSCLSVLSMSNLSKLYLKAQQIFYKNNSPVLLLALTVNSSFSCFKNSKFSLFNDQICAEFQQNCQNSGIIGSNQFVFSFGNIGKFGNNLLNISTQGTFSETQNKYCANYNFDKNQIKQFTNVDGTQEVTGSLQIGAIQVPVSIINDNSKVQSMNGILWILVATVVATILFVGFGLLKQWV
ncbi:Hypothetical_protein [Hexamita inflata]|uniref:Hypothetical_protein n=1 Tax=Hexamita inflata TaxID=28002 RepID=A0AA86UX56_9EUKA|nr:Hypothetical protein HINF_LOCUS55756 [Hexamita inflata]